MAKKRPSGWDIVAHILFASASPEYRQRQEMQRLRDDVSYYQALNAAHEARQRLQGIARKIQEIVVEQSATDIVDESRKALGSGE